MANLLSTITILETFTTGQYNKGSVVKVFYDPTTDLITVKITTSSGTYPLSSGPALEVPNQFITGPPDFDKNSGEFIQYNSIDNYYARQETGYTFSETVTEPTTIAPGTRRVTVFGAVSSFPYMIKKVQLKSIPKLEVAPAPDDIRLEFVSQVKASTESSADGSLTILAKGTNSPFTYFKDSPDNGGPGQSNGTFSSLRPGNYRLYAQDAEGYIAFIDVELRYVTIPATNANNITIGNYKVRWTIENDNLTDTEVYKTDIFQRGYTGSVNTVKGADVPFEFTRNADNQTFAQMDILSSSATVNVIAQTDNQFKDIALGDEEEFIVVRAKKNGATWDTQWSGMVNTVSYVDSLFPSPTEVSFTATDRTADLSNFKFILGNNESGNRVDAVISQLQILHICLSKLDLLFGYRVACNIFAENHTTTNKSPLEQTYLDTAKYLDGDEAMDCKTVVQDILTIYQAVLFSQHGYWYVVRKKEFLNTSISYVEYDTGLSFVSSGSWSPRINVAGPTTANRAVFKGAQTRTYTPVFNNIILNINTGLKENQSITPEFTSSKFRFSDGIFQGFEKWQIYSLSNAVNRNQPVIEDGDKIYWDIAIEGKGESFTYIEYAGNITYSAGDEFSLQANFKVDGYYETDDGVPFIPIYIDEYPPYAQFKWSLKIGNRYISATNRWTTTETINYHFFERQESFENFSKRFNLPEDGSTNQTFQLRFYPVDLSEADEIVNLTTDIALQGIANRLQAVSQAIALIRSNRFRVKDTRKTGDRIVIAIGNDFHYYELRYDNTRNSDTIDKIFCYGYQSTELPFAWVLIKVVNLPFRDSDSGFGEQTYCIGGNCNKIVQSLVTKTRFDSLIFKLNPNGDSVKEVIELSAKADKENTIDATYTLNSFDLGNLNPSLHKNYLRYSDNTPTSNWTDQDTSITTRIHEHVIRFFTKFTKRPKSRLTGSFRVDGVDFTSINVLFDDTDIDRLYISTGTSSDDKLQEFTGELLEIGSGDQVTESGFSNGFLQTGFR